MTWCLRLGSLARVREALAVLERHHGKAVIS